MIDYIPRINVDKPSIHDAVINATKRPPVIPKIKLLLMFEETVEYWISTSPRFPLLSTVSTIWQYRKPPLINYRQILGYWAWVLMIAITLLPNYIYYQKHHSTNIQWKCRTISQWDHINIGNLTCLGRVTKAVCTKLCMLPKVPILPCRIRSRS